MKRTIILLLAFLCYSCTVNRKNELSGTENQDNLLLSVLWYQKSAEMKALYLQGYNIAKKSLAEKIKTSDDGKPAAVVLDIDETILDNSPAEAYLIKNNVPFSDEIWKNWVSKAEAEACPGALEFTKYADSLGVEIFYITNREMPGELVPTIKNLKKLGFPSADEKHLVLKQGVSSKEERRNDINRDFRIVMLIGDNLADFDAVFDKRAGDLGFKSVYDNAWKFGSEFIILPNPMYGPWIDAATRDQDAPVLRERIIRSLNVFNI